MTIDRTHPEFAASWAQEPSDGFTASAPPGLEPFAFQNAGVQYALRRRDCLIADEMGLGKTVQALAYLNELNVSQALVLCPASLRINWRREAEKWLHWGDLKVVGYEEAVRHPDRVAGSWQAVVCDEAHYLKTPGAKRTQMTQSIDATRKLILTGTPVANRPVELWPLLRMLEPEVWKDYNGFGFKYCAGRSVMRNVKCKRKGGGYYTKRTKTLDFSGASNKAELQWLLRTRYMVRRLKKHVQSQLPEKQRQLITLDSKYAKSSAALCAKMFGAGELTPDRAAALRESDPVAFEKMSELRAKQAEEKVKPAIEFVRGLVEQVGQIVVFAHHRATIQALHGAFEGSRLIVGGMSDTSKQASADAFQAGECQVLIAHPVPGGTGFTLTRSNTVVFVELDWTPGVMAQAEDRVHRIGQKADSVHIIYLVMDGSLDARMCRTLLSKQSTIDAILDD